MNNQLKITRLISISISKYIFSKLVALMSHVRGNHFTVQSLNRLCRFSFLSHSTPILAARKDCQPCHKNHMSQSFQTLCESKLLNQRKQKKILKKLHIFQAFQNLSTFRTVADGATKTFFSIRTNIYLLIKIYLTANNGQLW